MASKRAAYARLPPLKLAPQSDSEELSEGTVSQGGAPLNVSGKLSSSRHGMVVCALGLGHVSVVASTSSIAQRTVGNVALATRNTIGEKSKSNYLLKSAKSSL